MSLKGRPADIERTLPFSESRLRKTARRSATGTPIEAFEEVVEPVGAMRWIKVRGAGESNVREDVVRYTQSQRTEVAS